MFEEYDYWRKQVRRGFIEFKFYHWDQLSSAISFIEKLSVYHTMPFVGMPGTPSYAPPSAKQLNLQLRRIPSEVHVGFHEAVQHHMRFTENHKRPKLQQALDVALQDDNIFVISISVVLERTSSSNTSKVERDA
ncbi:hypothetical protein F5148DRAFT_1279748 [Russula earlei]|uniref:Uncharacterized protein n=1 Tax=Russula earlei TaxID=71964 RepID=A0ACC0UMV2_9AGAM|nr:hypothetical protein F5148DRAFT_1279748 [Russula earlei]